MNGMTELLKRNPHVHPTRVQHLLAYLEKLKAHGIDVMPHYGIQHPFSQQPGQPDSHAPLRSMNRPSYG